MAEIPIESYSVFTLISIHSTKDRSRSLWIQHHFSLLSHLWQPLAVPHDDGVVDGGGGEEGVVGRPGQVEHVAAVAAQRVHHAPRLDVHLAAAAEDGAAAVRRLFPYYHL